MSSQVRFQRGALALLLVTMAVVLWGAFVRVTGSGAGCADHWPLCQGQIMPRSPALETVIELTHRATSGLAGLLSLFVAFHAFRAFPKRSPVRVSAVVGLLLMLLEGAIGALLVKRGLVAKNASSARAAVVGLHLCNTFLLLGAQTLTYHFARGGARLRLRGRAGRALLLLGLLLLALALGATGAITALGDTLFPATSLGAGVAEDFARDAHFLVRLRVYHPLLAVLGGALLVYAAQQLRQGLATRAVARWSLVLTLSYVLQLAVGSLNLLLLAPAPIQLAHLLLADVVWIALVMLGAHALAVPEESAEASSGVEVATLVTKPTR